MSEERIRTRAILSAYKKQKRNNIIRGILEDKKLNVPKRMSEKYVKSILDGTMNIDPSIIQIILDKLKKEKLNV